MSKSFKIAGLGEVLWDVFPQGEKFGGAPANFACHCHLLGAEAHIISCVGNDDRGATGRGFLDDHGVNTRGLATSDEERGRPWPSCFRSSRTSSRGSRIPRGS